MRLGNDIYNFIFNFISAFIPLLVVMFVILLTAGILQNIHIKKRNSRQPVIPVPVEVAAKRVDIVYHPYTGGDSDQAHTNYYVVFTFDNGQRMELKVPSSDYHIISEGARGTLFFQGSRYITFASRVGEMT